LSLLREVFGLFSKIFSSLLLSLSFVLASCHPLPLFLPIGGRPTHYRAMLPPVHLPPLVPHTSLLLNSAFPPTRKDPRVSDFNPPFPPSPFVMIVLGRPVCLPTESPLLRSTIPQRTWSPSPLQFPASLRVWAISLVFLRVESRPLLTSGFY